jgi:hypothetical protein
MAPMLKMAAAGALALTCVIAVSAQTPMNTLSPAERRDGFVLLFDGVSTKGWHQLPLQNDQNAGPWKARDGVLTYEPGESWLASDESYSDFVLRLDYRTTGADTDSGIFMRSPAAGYPSWTGMELEMKGNDNGAAPGLRTSMSLIGSAAALKAAHKAPGEWNTVDITLNKMRFTVVVNGEKIHDFSLDDPAYAVDRQHTPLADRAKTGFIGFQAHRNGAPAEYRNIRIKAIK